ncbi:MAG: hypothetical protein H6Q15_2157 [Bacteroidetes bacterium]|nr:hypothetical protein [Bacteroidota bacterium]
MKKFILTGMVLLSFCITSCTKDLSIGGNSDTTESSDSTSESPSNQQISGGYFVYSYENYAWGHQREGWIIDKSGIVKAYLNPDRYNLPDSNGYITQEKINENLSICNISIGHISQELLSYYNNISFAIKSDIFSDRISHGGDVGSIKYYYYAFESISGKYKAKLLCEDGDWATYNKDNNAIKVTNWLKSIQSSPFPPPYHTCGN